MAEHGTRVDPRNNDQSLTLLIKVSGLNLFREGPTNMAETSLGSRL